MECALSHERIKGHLSPHQFIPTMPTPHREVFTVINGASADQKGRWVGIGATFLNKDGSDSVRLLDALPVNGKLSRF
jgi:hypothetical protein